MTHRYCFCYKGGWWARRFRREQQDASSSRCCYHRLLITRSCSRHSCTRRSFCCQQ